MSVWRQTHITWLAQVIGCETGLAKRNASGNFFTPMQADKHEWQACIFRRLLVVIYQSSSLLDNPVAL